LAERLLRLCRDYDARLVINEDLVAARAIKADGLHLPAGADLGPVRAVLGAGALLGVSAHGPEDLCRAQEAGADYATLSPVFQTASKPGYGPALGLSGFRKIVRNIQIPVLALGGVDADTTAACLDSDAAGVAVMGGIMGAVDPGGATRSILRAIGG
jgi:thiamine-phosphate pyrophosphorylase